MHMCLHMFVERYMCIQNRRGFSYVHKCRKDFKYSIRIRKKESIVSVHRNRGIHFHKQI